MKRGTLRKNDLVQLLINGATRFQKFRARLGMTVKLGGFWPQGYNGLTIFYLFKCCGCRQLSADHTHGVDDLFINLDCHLCNH